MWGKVQGLIRAILPHVARLHYSNQFGDRKQYPQTWWLMPPRWIATKKLWPNGNSKLRRARPRLVLEWLCGILTGHELSETERGYSGKGVMDRSCRWCDKGIRIPMKEEIIPDYFHEFMGLMDEQI